MVMAYIDEMNKSGDKGKAAEKCFKQWYEFEPYQRPYESQHIDYLIFDLEHSSKKAPHLQDSLTPEEIIGKCVYSEDHKKTVPPEFLNSPEANRLSEKGKERLDIVSENCEKYFGVKDTSYKQMYSYDTGKTHAEQEKNPSLMTALKQKETEKPKASMMETLKKTEQAKPSEKPSLMATLTVTQKATDAVKAGIVKSAQNSR